MRILLTNDDGIHAPGLSALYQAIQPLGEVHVVAPASVQSATSHAVTFHKPVPTRREAVACKIIEQSFEGIAVDGRPADCVKLGLTFLVPGVDLVVSGMNSGANVGINTIYSGTVAAAREAAFIGVPAIAVSLHIGERGKTPWRKAAAHAANVIRRIISRPLERHTLLNVNIPILDNDAEPAGVRVVPVNTSAIVERYDITRDELGFTHYQAQDGFAFIHTAADSDVDALFQRYITVTPLHFDLTAHEQIKDWEKRLA